MTLLTRGKKPVTYRIPDDTGAGPYRRTSRLLLLLESTPQRCRPHGHGAEWTSGWHASCMRPCRSVLPLPPHCGASEVVTPGLLPLPAPPPADESFAKFEQSVKHIACDRTDAEAMKTHLQNKGFEGETRAGLLLLLLPGDSRAGSSVYWAGLGVAASGRQQQAPHPTRSAFAPANRPRLQWCTTSTVARPTSALWCWTRWAPFSSTSSAPRRACTRRATRCRTARRTRWTSSPGTRWGEGGCRVR